MSSPKPLITIGFTPVNAVLIGADRHAKLITREALSYLVDGFEHMNVAGHWDGRSSFFDFKTETFPTGFVYKVQAALMKAGYPVVVRSAGEVPAPLGPARPVVDGFGADPRYEYQFQVAEKLIKFRQVIARVATGGGKSRIARIAYKRIARPTLFVTTRGILMHQMADAIREMGEPCGVMGDEVWTPRPTGFNVAMVQTLAAWLANPTEEQELERRLKNREAAEDRQVATELARLKRAKAPESHIAQHIVKVRQALERQRVPDERLIADVKKAVAEQQKRRETALATLLAYEFVILEEAHEASGNSYYEILRQCKNAHYRLSLTGTPFMKESEEANLRLEASSGPVAITVSEKQLIDAGILARPFFKFVKLHNPAPSYTAPDKDGKMRTHKLFRSTPWQKAYEIGIVHNEERNRAIVHEVKRAVDHGLTAMILVSAKKHGALLSGLLTEAGVRTNYIFGEHHQDERKAALLALGDGRLDCLIGSTILDVGVDVPAVGMIVLAGAGKAEVALRQRIGRGLRAKKSGPNVALVVDFIEATNNHLIDHQRQRKAIINATPGFAEGIVNDFDYAALGFTRRAA